MVKMLEFGNRQIIGKNYTQYVALPKDWLRTHELDVGDAVKISLVEDGALKITKLEAELLNDVKELELEGVNKKPDISKIKSLLDKVKQIAPHIFEILKPVITEYIKKKLGV
ncbi:MAG: AbrB/MazE/SpoVT family DNA-binding domain-containing protein [Candidatus Methanoperedens sp.]